MENRAEKIRITISLDKRLVEIIDKQRGSVKRSTYINDVLRQYFSPSPLEDKMGGTFVTTLELRKTLKNIHEKLKIVDALVYNVRDLEAVVYDALFGGKKASKRRRRAVVQEIKHGSVLELLSKRATEERVRAWVEKRVKKFGTIVLSRDFEDYCKLEGVKKTKDAFRRYLKSMGLRYDKKRRAWVAK